MTFRVSTVFVLLALGCVAPVCMADTVLVHTVDDLLRAFSTTTGPITTVIELQEDLDFATAGTELVYPLGAQSGVCTPFGGVFHGNGHVIRGIAMDNADKTLYNHAALICSLQGATVQDLVIDESCTFTGNWAGALAVRADRAAIVRNVASRATVVATNYGGGLVGAAPACDGAQLAFVECTTSGSVRAAEAPAAGLLGYLAVARASTSTTTMTIESCASTGTVTAASDPACGLVCVGSQDHIELTVANSISKANVSGTTAYGIAGGVNVKQACNVVSMGSTNGTQGAYSFWTDAADATSTFVLDGTCQNCGAAAEFVQDPTDGLYYVIREGTDRVDERLNEVVTNKGYTMLWSKKLDLVTSLPGSSSSGTPSSSPSSNPSSMSHESHSSHSSNNDSLGARLRVVAPLVFFSILFFAL